ncbi:MAG: hypothetical protein R3Y13_04725 [bacterium]
MELKNYDQIDFIFIYLICTYLFLLTLLLIALFFKGGRRKRERVAFIRDVKYELKAKKSKQRRLAKKGIAFEEEYTVEDFEPSKVKSVRPKQERIILETQTITPQQLRIVEIKLSKNKSRTTKKVKGKSKTKKRKS